MTGLTSGTQTLLLVLVCFGFIY